MVLVLVVPYGTVLMASSQRVRLTGGKSLCADIQCKARHATATAYRIGLVSLYGFVFICIYLYLEFAFGICLWYWYGLGQVILLFYSLAYLRLHY
jgi:hypothetical protein